MAKAFFQGTVQRKSINIGSKSEHEAIVLDFGHGSAVKLKLTGSNAFDYTAFEDYVGQAVDVRGTLSADGRTLVVDSKADISPTSGPLHTKPGPIHKKPGPKL